MNAVRALLIAVVLATPCAALAGNKWDDEARARNAGTWGKQPAAEQAEEEYGVADAVGVVLLVLAGYGAYIWFFGGYRWGGAVDYRGQPLGPGAWVDSRGPDEKPLAWLFKSDTSPRGGQFEGNPDEGKFKGRGSDGSW